MTLGAVKQYVVVLLTLSTFTLHKQREDSNASPPSMNGMYGNFIELEHGQGSDYQCVLIQICGYTQEGFHCTMYSRSIKAIPIPKIIIFTDILLYVVALY